MLRAEGSAANDEGASNAAGSNAAPSSSGESDPSAPPSADSDAEPPAADAGVDAAPKPKIPAPTKGYLHAYAIAVIEAGKTTNVMFDFQIIPAPSDDGMGTLVAVAVGGSCAFSVNGSSVGSGATVKVPLKAGTYSVACKPVSGATKSRSVTVTEGNTAMAMFKR